MICVSDHICSIQQCILFFIWFVEALVTSCGQLVYHELPWSVFIFWELFFPMSSFKDQPDRYLFRLLILSLFFPSLRAENLLLTADQRTVKLVDLGLAREETLTEMMTAETGTYRWMAPEVCSAFRFVSF